MRANSNLFMFNTPISDLLTKATQHNAHFFIKDANGIALMSNDLHAQYFGMSSVEEIIGQNSYDLLSKSEMKKVAANDIIIVQGDAPQLFYEKCLRKECLSIKTQLMDLCNNTVGIGMIDFYFHQAAFKDMITLINQLVYLRPAINKIKYNYIANAYQFNKISNRERECVYYLARGMTCKEIAQAMRISYRTVEKHLENIKDKLTCHSRSDIISKVFEMS